LPARPQNPFQSLYLAHNRLAALPEGLVNLTLLKSLGISGNQFTALPEGLGNLTSVEPLGFCLLSSSQNSDVPTSQHSLSNAALAIS
jgi:Leucine-rich repeat (LRR) protein